MYLISGFLQFAVILIENHPQSKQRHDDAVPEVSKHHSKQEGKGNDCIWSYEKV